MTHQPSSESHYATLLSKLYYLNTSGPCVSQFFLDYEKNLCTTSYTFTAEKKKTFLSLDLTFSENSIYPVPSLAQAI